MHERAKPNSISDAARHRSATRALSRVLLATTAPLAIVLGWMWVLETIALSVYPNPGWNPVTQRAYIWLTYRFCWAGAAAAILVAGRIWPRWGVVPGAIVAGAAAALMWGTADIHADYVGADGRSWGGLMGDRRSAALIVVASAAASLWAWRHESLRRRGLRDVMRER